MVTSSENNCEEKESSEKIQFIQNLKNLKLKDVFKKGVNNATFVVMQKIVYHKNFKISKYTLYNQDTFFSSHKMIRDRKIIVTLKKLWFF